MKDLNIDDEKFRAAGMLAGDQQRENELIDAGTVRRRKRATIFEANRRASV